MWTVKSIDEADEWLLKQNINEGDEWPEDVEAFEKTSQSLNWMNEFMNHYMDALEDLNDE